MSTTLLKCFKSLLSMRPFSLSSSQRLVFHFHSRKFFHNNKTYCCNGTRRVSCLTSMRQPDRFASEKYSTNTNGDRPESGMSTKELWLYNTMSKKKELFKPKVAGKVGMYVCGVTAYDLSHIGHARVYVSFDVLFRYLRYLGYEVYYVRNFTDVDDKIIARANELRGDPTSLSRRYCEEFHRDMAYLNCLPPSVGPRVSDHMPQIIDMINHVLLQLREKALICAKLTEEQILQKIEEQAIARKNKECEKSDAIREDLAAVGITLMDSPEGTTWKPDVPLALQGQAVATC